MPKTDSNLSTPNAKPESPVAPATDGRRDKTEVAEERTRRIAESAYFKAERRGFEPGREEADWLEAEKELSAGSEHRQLTDTQRDLGVNSDHKTKAMEKGGRGTFP